MDLFICLKCGANLIEHGIIEVIAGGLGKTEIQFNEKKSIIGGTDITDFSDQWVNCGFCGAELRDRTAIEIIEAYEGDLPHVRNDCTSCHETFDEKTVCNGCEYRAGQCTGIREGENKDLCQQCCAEEFGNMIVRNPFAIVARDSV